MSALYNLEPQPTASVIIHTTLGEIMVELFAKQTPLTCRNFLQLSLDGYYDGTIFHRLVPNFILQGGDPTGTGNGGESIYNGGALGDDLDPWPMDQLRGRNAGPMCINFKDEFHSRLKFNRRGLLGMANDGRPDTNGSQFFFTLDKDEELNGKNTLFGRVAGDTIYNLAKIGESEVEQGSERPLYAVKIERIEVLVNPFEDMTKRSRVVTRVQPKAPASKDQKKRKGGKQLLSFGDEESDEGVPAFKKTKFDTRLIAVDEADEERPRAKKPTDREPAKEAKHSSTDVHLERKDEDAVNHSRPEHAVDTEQTPQPKSKIAMDQEPKLQGEAYPSPPELSPQPEPIKKSALQKAQEEMAALKASMRRTVHSEQAVTEKEKSALESIPETSIRGRKRRPEGSNTLGNEDADTVRMLKAFQSRLDKAPPEKETAQPSDAREEEGGGVGSGTAGDEAELCDLHFIANCQSCTAWDKQEKEESDDEGWMSHSLSLAAEKLGRDLSNRRKAEDELVVIDPREKARTLKEEKQAKREARAGGSGRAWDQAADQARNAKLARAASLAGRGAK